MKTTELRIGNLINNMVGSECAVVGITSKAIWVKHGGSAPESAFNPIEITEYYLLKFGFIKSEYFWRIGFFTIKETYDGFVPVGEKYSIGVEIKYIHQLQNLYFALTGQELTITT